MILNGTKYHMPFVLIAGKTEDEDLIFGNVVSIFVHCQSVLFEVEILNSHFVLTTMPMLYRCYHLLYRHTSLSIPI